MKIRHKILASLFSVLAMLVVVAVFAYSSTMHVDFFRKRSLVLEGQLVALTNLRAQVRNLLLETYEVGFVEGLKGHTDDLKKEKELTQIKFKELEAAIPDTEKRSSVINVLRSEYSEVEKGLDSSIQLTAQGKIGLARAAILDARENKFNKGFIQKITEFIDSQKAEVKESSSGLKQSISQLQNILIVLTALASLLAFGLAFFLSKSIGTRLANLEKATKKISAGDFSVSLPESGSDEVSFLSQAFNSMATSLAWARDELAQQQQFLANSSKMSSLGEMAGGVAHEINNPLAVIKSLSGQVQELIDEEPLDKNLIKTMMEKVENTTDRIAKIVQGLRSFSRDGSKDPYQAVNLQQMIDETLSFCRERFQASGTKLLIEGEQGKLSFEGRSTEVSQVLLNLLNNANDAIADRQEKWIKVSTYEQPDWVELRVTDCGNGIPLEVQKKIFQPFFTTKAIGKGTGMGLSISIGIIKGHFGELKIDNQCPNTCFVIRLPKKRGAAALPAAA